MDDTLLMIPPCCVNKKLPQAISQAPRRTLTFYTQGDVTMEKFYRAIARMLDTGKAHKDKLSVMVLSMGVMASDTFVFLQQCFEREWITHLVLTTARKADEMIDKYLFEFKDRILYACSKDVTEASNHMVLYNNDTALTLHGAMLDRIAAHPCAYSVVFYPDHANWDNRNDWGNPLKIICFFDVLRVRQQVIKTKATVKDVYLKRFINLNFPPYADDSEPLSHNDHHSFGAMG